jgi:2-enoate reductase
MLEKLIPYNGVEVLTSSKVVKATEKGVLVDTNGSRYEILADTVVLAVGYSAEKSLYEEIKFEISELHLIGDARNVSNIMYAIWDAYEVASNL